jgi:hypothetical protein
MQRYGELYGQIASFTKRRLSDFKQLDLFYEFYYIIDILMERWQVAQQTIKNGSGKRVFISHSSVDKLAAKWISVDLSNKGHRPWLDEWEIKIGESIPSKIARGLDDCDAVVVLLSPHSVNSGWVEREWQSIYWDEVAKGEILVLPVLLEDCEIPRLLKMKKYADFRKGTSQALRDLSDALLDAGAGPNHTSF